jgi:mannonate dehydratase
MTNLCRAGIEVICCDFMPVFDWTRTDLAWRQPNGATCMRFDFALFDIRIPRRAGAVASMTLAEVRAHLAEYDAMPADRLRQRLIDFLAEGTPLTQDLGIRLCCHPDDPPFRLLGFPRIMSTEADDRAVLDAVDLAANGRTFCTGLAWRTRGR